MYGMNLTRAEFDALDRLFSSLDKRSSISGVKFSTVVTARGGSFKRVEFLSGFGNRAFDLDANGDSAPVEADGLSDLTR